MQNAKDEDAKLFLISFMKALNQPIHIWTKEPRQPYVDIISSATYIFQNGKKGDGNIKK